MPRTKNLDSVVDEKVRKLLEMTFAADMTEAQKEQFEARHKAVMAAVTWAKVKHKIDEGAAGSAFNDDEEPV